ncbi:tubulin polyglutamylase TTLL4-like isoform X2 [Actinia tenebrosa]|uniref:Tubulin polyglutamylase TTLL4-like isoform X2 n=1 Tax=Actinia tenebrosa TaxID=6105 RepID=A0A6P8H9I4_ACTTE|nr:tubulin polyglutamylase TTLL4-like isoform X2 [Actinia tenebrosa]
MNNKPNWESSLIAKFGELKVNSKPPTGLLREKAKPLLLKPESETVNGLIKPNFVPHPPQGPKKATSVPSPPVCSPVKKPTPPSTAKTKGTFRRKYSKSEEIWYEDRVSGDGEASKDDDIYSEKDSILERQPGDGCFSDIAEEDEEDDDECMNDDDEVGDEEDIDYDCDGLEEEELEDFSENDDDDNASTCTGLSRTPSARSRTSSAKISINNLKSSSARTRTTSAFGGRQVTTDVSIKQANNNWVQDGPDDIKPALTPSLFAHIPPTIYFTIEGEKVAPLPHELRKLLRWKMSSITPNVVKQCIARSGFRATKRPNDWLGYWGKHMKGTAFKSIREHQKVNHFPGTFQIGRKDRLWGNISRLMIQHGKKEFGFLPQTYCLPYDFKLLKRAWDEGGSRQKWILKPPASARGIGIRVIHKWSQIPRKRPVIVQRYLSKPFLINGSKFDLRIYVYVTSYDPLRIYIFEDGLVRFATCKYSSSVKSLSNRFMHLTNYSVNKKNEGAYQPNSDDTLCQGHKWSLKSLWGYMKKLGINHANVWENIKDIIVKAIIGSESFVNILVKQNVRRRSCCHELFGCDVMLDENLKPWLLEVNISPSLHSNSQLDRNIKGQMIKDLMNLAAFRIPENLVTTTTASTSSLNLFVQDKVGPALSSDERAKHAFYTKKNIDERTKQTVLDILTPNDVRILAETEDEYNRRGCFQRAFPSMASHKYLKFFQTIRYNDVLLDEWTRKYMREGRSTLLGVSLLQALTEQKIHVGTTNDPAHQWTCPQGVSYRSLSSPLVGVVA